MEGPLEKIRDGNGGAASQVLATGPNRRHTEFRPTRAIAQKIVQSAAPSTHTAGTPLPSRNGESWILLASAVAALAPYAIYHRLFLQMYWFGDEFDLVDQFDRLGFWRWVWLAFAENFVPLFKVLWGGAVLAFGGSYAAMIALVWLTHALNVGLLGRLMRTCGLPWLAVLLAQVVFGLTVENYETLAWSVQWSAMLSVTFMLLGLDRIFLSPRLGTPLGLALASGLSFSRGALTGPLIGSGSFLHDRGMGLFPRFARAALFLVPAIAVAGLIFLLAKGNQHYMAGHFGQAAVYGTWYFCLNPSHALLLMESLSWRTTLALGLLKVALYAWALLRSRDRARDFFTVLILFDLGNSALLGIGRYHMGIPTAVSSRYQYAALLSFMPIAGYWFSCQWQKLNAPARALRTAATCLLAALALALCLQWPSEMNHFAEWRDTRSRHILFEEPNPGAQAVPGIPDLPMDRAKDLIARYHLH